MAALADATGVAHRLLADLPALLFDGVRDGVPGRSEEALRDLGGAGYAIPLDPALVVDRTLVPDVIGDGNPVLA